MLILSLSLQSLSNTKNVVISVTCVDNIDQSNKILKALVIKMIFLEFQEVKDQTVN